MNYSGSVSGLSIISGLDPPAPHFKKIKPKKAYKNIFKRAYKA
jgi:hypothetical protein